MSKIPVYLNFYEIKKHLRSLKTTDAKINYYEYILGIYNEMFSHKSLNDINSYISKYKLGKQLKNIEVEKPIDHSDLKDALENVNGLYIGTGYEILHDKISLLYTSIEYDLSNIKFFNFIADSGFKLAFTKENVMNVLNKLPDDSSKLKWLKELNKRTYSIATNFTDRYIDLLYKIYNLKEIYPITMPPKDKSALNKYKGKYSSFRNSITISFGHFLKTLEYDLQFEINVQKVKSYGTLDLISEDDKYILQDYKFDTLNRFAEKAFSYLEEKIEYFSYALSVFYSKYPVLAKENPMQDEIRKTEYRLNYLRTKYEMRKNGISLLDPPCTMELKKDSSKNSNAYSNANLNYPVIKDKQKPIWLKDKLQLIELLRQLQVMGYIEDITETPNWEVQYLALFINNDTGKCFSDLNAKPVLWKEAIIDLAFLVYYLNKQGMKNLLDPSRYLSKISDIFLYIPKSSDKSEKPVKVKPVKVTSLTTSLNKIKKGKKVNNDIDQIVNNVKKTRSLFAQ
ncbi:MAG: hypothetical protein ACOYN6_08720 [Ignavibacteria bacterium]|nr:hypothetical protein [Ignavibacteriota bacterium]